MRKLQFLLSICLLMILCFSCKGTDEDLSGIVFSEEVNIESSTAKSFINLDRNGNPASISVEISNEVIASNLLLEDKEYEIPLPSDVDDIPFKGIGLNWTEGDIESYVYNSPHFGIRFYTISEIQRDRITSDLFDASYTAPDDQYLPKDYLLLPDSAKPGMGSCWIDIEADEFNGEAFSQTLIYGFHDGKMTCIEPMITLDFLSRAKNLNSEIKQPEKYEQMAYYPTTYSINVGENKVLITLGGMVLR